MTTSAPTIETKRFILTGHTLNDFTDSFAMWSNPIVARYTTSHALTEEEAWARLLRNIGHWAAMPYGPWVFHEKSTGKFIGEGGLSDYKRTMTHGFDVPEASLALTSEVHGKGYSLELLQGMLAWADEHLPFSQTACLIYPENLPSIRIAEKCGFIRQRETLYKDEVNLILLRSNPHKISKRLT